MQRESLEATELEAIRARDEIGDESLVWATGDRAWLLAHADALTRELDMERRSYETAERFVKRWAERAEKAWADIEELKTERDAQGHRVQVLTEALRFYGDEGNWEEGPNHAPLHERRSEAMWDSGRRARAALKGEGE